MKLDINTATRDQMLDIRGIGRVRVKEIIEHREQSGGFYSIDELFSLTSFQDLLPAERDGLHERLEVYPETKPSGPRPARLDLNSASRQELLRIEGIGEARVEDILQRRQRGPFRSIEEIDTLPRFREITPEQRRTMKQQLKVH